MIDILQILLWPLQLKQLELLKDGCNLSPYSTQLNSRALG